MLQQRTACTHTLLLEQVEVAPGVCLTPAPAHGKKTASPSGMGFSGMANNRETGCFGDARCECRHSREAPEVLAQDLHVGVVRRVGLGRNGLGGQLEQLQQVGAIVWPRCMLEAQLLCVKSEGTSGVTCAVCMSQNGCQG